jgi:hypothetical protein
MLIGHNTFTGFHRCYYEDDEVFNNNMSKEDIDIFKNNYKGRIVISTGKIKTDSSRDIPKTEEEGTEVETKTEWYSLIDKDGIMTIYVNENNPHLLYRLSAHHSYLRQTLLQGQHQRCYLHRGRLLRLFLRS